MNEKVNTALIDRLEADLKEHEQHDNKRFSNIDNKLDKLIKFQYVLAGGGVTALGILTFVLKHYEKIPQ